MIFILSATDRPLMLIFKISWVLVLYMQGWFDDLLNFLPFHPFNPFSIYLNLCVNIAHDANELESCYTTQLVRMCPHKCVSGGLNEAYWPLNGKWVGREAWGQGGSCERSQLKGQEINVRRCYERQLLHQLMTSRVKKTVLWESLGETSIKPQQNLTVSRQRWRWSTAEERRKVCVYSYTSHCCLISVQPVRFIYQWTGHITFKI